MSTTLPCLPLSEVRDRISILREKENAYECDDYLNSSTSFMKDKDNKEKKNKTTVSTTTTTTTKETTSSSSSTTAASTTTTTMMRTGTAVASAETTSAGTPSSSIASSMKKKRSGVGTIKVNASYRGRLCTWCYQIIDFCEMKRETAIVAIYTMDRFMCTVKGRELCLTNQRQYQLAVMTSLYMMIKIRESAVVKMRVTMFVKLSEGFYNEQDFLRMERLMLQELQWKLHAPIPLSFVYTFMSLLGGTISTFCTTNTTATSTSNNTTSSSSVDPFVVKIIMDIATRQTELAVEEYYLSVLYLPSQIAIAAILNALGEVDDDDLVPFHVQNQFIAHIQQCYYFGSTTPPPTTITPSSPHLQHTDTKIPEIQVKLNALYLGCSSTNTGATASSTSSAATRVNSSSCSSITSGSSAASTGSSTSTSSGSSGRHTKNSCSRTARSSQKNWTTTTATPTPSRKQQVVVISSSNASVCSTTSTSTATTSSTYTTTTSSSQPVKY